MQDNILPKLMASTISQEDLFKKEISKYDQICEEISQNINAQEQLLLQIQVINCLSLKALLSWYKFLPLNCYRFRYALWLGFYIVFWT